MYYILHRETQDKSQCITPEDGDVNTPKPVGDMTLMYF